MERIAFGKMILHQSCFCCSQCKQKLSLKNYFSVFGRLYCKVHHDQMTQGGTAVSSHEKSAAGSVPVTDLKKTKNTKEFTMAEGDMSQGRSHGEFIPTNQTCDSNDWWLRTKHITSAQESYNIAARHKGTSRWSWPNLLSATNISDTLKKGGNRGIPGRFSRVHEMNLPKVPSQDGKIFQNPTKVKEKDVLFQTLKADTNVCAASPKGMKTSKMELLQRKYEIACAKPAIKSVSRPNTRFITTNFRDIRSSPKSKLNNTESSHVLTSKAPSVAPPMSETIRLPKILQTIKEPKAGDTPIPKTSGESNNNMIQSMAEDTRTYENEASLKTSPSQQQLIQIETGMELSQLPPESNSPAHEVSLSSQTPRHDHELEG
ncbi:LIM domain and actin-binding protein 1-like [Xenopus tropicalis]|uniref:LIM domain and actin-binding protein 1-like n=1 Tax=Xenopus tropicalis TaxID=8364 RepID=A0A8J1JQZ8_XENTR|nr:LIM domain and actin-binding protein 1-like [Xenopus tropicalis]